MTKPRVFSQFDPGTKRCPGCFRVSANAQRICPNVECKHEFYPFKSRRPHPSIGRRIPSPLDIV